MAFSRETIKKLHVYAQSLPPCHDRAQCYQIANFEFSHKETIAERLERDHFSISQAFRVAGLMVAADCAKLETKKICKNSQYLQVIIFEDGSELF